MAHMNPGLCPGLSSAVLTGLDCVIDLAASWGTRPISSGLFYGTAPRRLLGLGIRYFCCSFWAAIWPAAVLEVFSWA